MYLHSADLRSKTSSKAGLVSDSGRCHSFRGRNSQKFPGNFPSLGCDSLYSDAKGLLETFRRVRHLDPLFTFSIVAIGSLLRISSSSHKNEQTSRSWSKLFGSFNEGERREKLEIQKKTESEILLGWLRPSAGLRFRRLSNESLCYITLTESEQTHSAPVHSSNMNYAVSYLARLEEQHKTSQDLLGSFETVLAWDTHLARLRGELKIFCNVGKSF